MFSPFTKLKSIWSAFRDQSPPTVTWQYPSYSSRPDRTRHRIQNERSIINSIYNRISVDGMLINVKHVRVNKDGNYEDTIYDSLNNVLSSSANIDQTGRVLISDLIYSMLDEGCVCLFPAYTSADPYITESYEVLEARVGKIIEWQPLRVKVEAYDENTGQKKQTWVDKRFVPIIENPFYPIMNEPNSTMQRLVRVLNQLDRINEQNSSGKMDLIVQLPFTIKTDAQQKIANQRKESIEAQLTNSKYGIAYIDGTEKVIQLNRPVENNLWEQAKELKQDLFNQMGITMEILNGTADEKTMMNYYSRIIEPILTVIVEEIERKWISQTARSQRQAIRFFRDPFKLLPVSDLAELSDKLTRNEIMSSNEIRVKIGLPPSKDPKANKLINSNLNQPEDKQSETNLDVKINDVEHSQILHYGMPRRSGRYPYGSGDRPYQHSQISSTKVDKKKLSNGTYEYSIQDEKGSKLSTLKIYDYNIDGFDWVLMADVETNPDQRGRGFATKLINDAYADLKTNGINKGIYLFVRKNNDNAIRLYEKLNFNNLKSYHLDDGDYYIMTKGNKNIKQFENMNFS